MMDRSMIMPPGSSTGSLMRVSIRGSEERRGREGGEGRGGGEVRGEVGVSRGTGGRRTGNRCVTMGQKGGDVLWHEGVCVGCRGSGW